MSQDSWDDRNHTRVFNRDNLRNHTDRLKNLKQKWNTDVIAEGSCFS